MTEDKKEYSYASAGVNIIKGDDASTILFNVSKESFKNRDGDIGEVIIPFDDFTGLRCIDVSNLPENSVLSVGFDGVGTKQEIAQRMGKHDTIAFDLLAMVCDDAVVRGAEPVLVGSVLDVNKVDVEVIRQIAQGYLGASKKANVAIINGELAEIGKQVGGYGSFNYNWGAGLIWFAKKEKLFTGDEPNNGDYIISLKENGFRSNGLSLVRKIFNEQIGEEWHKKKHNDSYLGNLVLEPSIIYSKFIVFLHGGFKKEGVCKITGVANVTGGGIPGKLKRILKKKKLGAVLDELYEPPEIMKYCKEIGNVSDKEAYKTWNMGQGMFILTPNESEAKRIVDYSKDFGLSAKISGRVVTDTENIVIKRNGYSDLIF